MSAHQLHAVTGAFGFTGKYITKRLLTKGYGVRTITHSVNRKNPFGSKVEVFPYNFENPEKLTQSLRGVSILYNTYWVRFNDETFGFASALEHTKTVFDAAINAGVKRIVHISITNASEDSSLEYFCKKAKAEKALRASGISYAILRPAVIFGKGCILINNIAWLLRRFPIFGVFGNGKYRIQPIYVDDLARLTVEQGERREDIVINAIGPETFSYKGLVEAIGSIIGKRRPIVSIPPVFGYLMGKIIGKITHDVFITRDEIKGLIGDLLYVDSPSVGQTKLTEWARIHAKTLGKHYSSELSRRMDRLGEYTLLENRPRDFTG